MPIIKKTELFDVIWAFVKCFWACFMWFFEWHSKIERYSSQVGCNILETGLVPYQDSHYNSRVDVSGSCLESH